MSDRLSSLESANVFHRAVPEMQDRFSLVDRHQQFFRLLRALEDLDVFHESQRDRLHSHLLRIKIIFHDQQVQIAVRLSLLYAVVYPYGSADRFDRVVMNRFSHWDAGGF